LVLARLPAYWLVPGRRVARRALRVCAWRQALGNNRSFLLAAPTPNASGCHVTLTSIDYMLKRRPAFTRFLDDSRICLSNNAPERALRGIALGRRAWLFAGSDRAWWRAGRSHVHPDRQGKSQWADPRAWLADARGAPSPTLLPCHGSPAKPQPQPQPPDHHPLRPWPDACVSIGELSSYRNIVH
jgi:hypothetical protein